MRDGDVQTRSRAADFLGGSDNRLRPAQQFSHSIAAGYMPQRPMLQFARGADDRSLPVRLDYMRIAT